MLAGERPEIVERFSELACALAFVHYDVRALVLAVINRGTSLLVISAHATLREEDGSACYSAHLLVCAGRFGAEVALRKPFPSAHFPSVFLLNSYSAQKGLVSNKHASSRSLECNAAFQTRR